MTIYLVPLEGLEPPRLSALRSKRSASTISPQGHSGAVGETRTPDLMITNQLLYQLSYYSNFGAG
jgi:hypothetical protein